MLFGAARDSAMVVIFPSVNSKALEALKLWKSEAETSEHSGNLFQQAWIGTLFPGKDSPRH